MPDADVKLLKAALEEAKFESPELREKVYECINELAEDLVDVNYISSVSTDNAFDELEEMLNNIEAEEEEVEEEDDDIDPSTEDDEEDNIEEEDDDDDDDDEEDIDEEEENEFLKELEKKST